MSNFTCPDCQIPFGSNSIASTTPHRYRLQGPEPHPFDLCDKCHNRWASKPNTMGKRLPMVAKRVAKNPAEYCSGGDA